MNIKSFTSLRGLACLIVVGTHVWTIFDLPRLVTERYGSANSFQNIIRILVDRTFNGQAAVEIFFVLSGCVLALSLMNGSAAENTPWVKVFYVKRFFRIYPALWLSIAFTLCLWPLIKLGLTSPAYSDWAMSAFPKQITAPLVGLSLASVYVHLNWPMWTLRVELFYSILFPAIFLLVHNRRTRLPFLVFLALVALAPIPRILSLHYALAFGLGALIPLTRGIQNFRYRLIGLGLIPVLMYFRILLESSFNLKNIETVEILIAFAIVYCLFHNKNRIPLLDGRVFGYMGTISYSVYVLHFPIVFGLAACMVKVLGTPAIQQQPLLMASLLGVLTLLVTIPVSMVSNRFVEDAGNSLGKRLAASWFSRRPVAPIMTAPLEER
jgi:peptidoglycan/LPS O-acetylase OafA/YrhL